VDILENKSDTLEKFCNVALEKDGGKSFGTIA